MNRVILGLFIVASCFLFLGNFQREIKKLNYKYSQKTKQYEPNTTDDKGMTKVIEKTQNNLKQDIISKLQNKGYGCESVEIEVVENYEIEKITIKGIYEFKEKEKESEDEKTVSKVNEVIINNVQIGEKDNSIKDQVVKGIPKSEEKELKKYLNETYAVKEKNIVIE